jgi:hypothetical protein
MPSRLEPRIYRYIVRVDAGTAPNPWCGFCTLAICKPRIRRSAREGDWVVGFQSRNADRIVYAMLAEQKLGFDEYWRTPKFRDRRPDRTDYPDNLYRPLKPGARAEADFELVPNRVHPPDEISHKRRDLSGQFVVVSNTYWYFGAQGADWPTLLRHLRPISARGKPIREIYKLRGSDPTHEIEILEHWLRGFGPPGKYGDPRRPRLPGGAAKLEHRSQLLVEEVNRDSQEIGHDPFQTHC